MPFQVILFFDAEGIPIQELSALVMDISKCCIIAVYHEHAYCPPNIDRWARYHVHGLNPSLLKRIGFVNEEKRTLKNGIILYHVWL